MERTTKILKVIDIVFEGVGFSKMIWIISKDSEQIANKISSTVATA